MGGRVRGDLPRRSSGDVSRAGREVWGESDREGLSAPTLGFFPGGCQESMETERGNPSEIVMYYPHLIQQPGKVSTIMASFLEQIDY
jgi:hypothetical protein